MIEVKGGCNMNKKIIFGILILGVLVTAGFVSAGLFSKARITGNAVSEGWTPWYDRDNAGGNGDYETLKDIIREYGICENPTAIECRTVKGKIDSSKTGQTVHCDTEYGFYCLNRENPGGSLFSPNCEDYEVRYYCGVDVPFCGVLPCKISIGESKKVRADGMDYKITLDGISSATTTEASITINGESKTFTEGQSKTYVFDGKEFYVSVENIFRTSESTGYVAVDFEKVSNCTDSDGGLNYYVKGEVYYQNQLFIDGCLQTGGDLANPILSGEVVEQYCLDGKLESKNYMCPNGCKDGACIKSSSTEVTYQGVLDMLSNCESRRGVLLNSSSEITGNAICGEIGKSCLITFDAGHYSRVQGVSFRMENFPVLETGEDCSYRWIPSTAAFAEGADHMSVQAICCSPPN